ncbi:hypothetical protein HD554DRAFT_2041823, partial [Boletus coccyginus]
MDFLDVKATKATSIDLHPVDNSDVEMDSSQDEAAERAMQPTGLRAALLREFGSTLKIHQELTDLPNPGTLEAVKARAIDFCLSFDVSYKGSSHFYSGVIRATILDNGAGCIKLLDSTMKAKDFVCPRCMRAKRKPMPYKTESYIHHHTYLQHTENPLWAAFLSLGNESTYCEDMLTRCLLEHFSQERENQSCVPELTALKLHILKRPIRTGNNRPSAVHNDIMWMEKAKWLSDVLLYIDTHAESTTGNLIVGGSRNNRKCATIHQLIFSYFGDPFIKALAETDALIGQGYTI